MSSSLARIEIRLPQELKEHITELAWIPTLGKRLNTMTV